MSDTRYDLGSVIRLEADAVGLPGQRTFRLLLAGEDAAACLWLEKEELQALGVAIDQLLAQLSGGPEWKPYGAQPEPYTPTEDFPDPSIEFKVGQLSLGYEPDSSQFLLLAHEAEADPDGPATFTCMATAAQLRALSRRIESVVSAGRPRCPLCGEPVDDDGHTCIRAN